MSGGPALTDLDEGVMQTPVDTITVVNTNNADRMVIPTAVNHWLETIDQETARMIVERWYASEK